MLAPARVLREYTLQAHIFDAGVEMYPIYDRSGVDDDIPRPLAVTAPPPKRSAPPACEVLVCHAGTCRRRGAEAVLTEIEELVNANGGSGYCTVRQSGCLGYCSEAPNAVVREKRSGATAVHMRIRSMEASAKVVERVTGTKPVLDGPASGRLQELRTARARQHAVSVSHWNTALSGLAEQAAQRPALRSELAALLAKAGYPNGVVGDTMPSAIENYSPWSLQGVTPVSKHSAIFHLTSADRKRGTPHPRGSGRMPEPVTWHTTLIAEVGPNGEGPLPWVEREYTPVRGLALRKSRGPHLRVRGARARDRP